MCHSAANTGCTTHGIDLILPFLPLCRVLSRDGDPHVEFLEDGQVLKVKSVRLRDQGLYQCLASNNAGTQMRQFRLTVQGLCFTPDSI